MMPGNVIASHLTASTEQHSDPGQERQSAWQTAPATVQQKGSPTMTDEIATVFVCTSCRTSIPGDLPGRALIEAVDARLRAQANATVSVQAVECLAVCKRPCTIAFSASGKWTYVVGDLDPTQHADDLVSMSLKYAASQDGIVPWRERPQIFRKGTISRIPPLRTPTAA